MNGSYLYAITVYLCGIRIQFIVIIIKKRNLDNKAKLVVINPKVE